MIQTLQKNVHSNKNTIICRRRASPCPAKILPRGMRYARGRTVLKTIFSLFRILLTVR